MTEKRQFRAIKGTRDILPPDSALWNWFEETARETIESYNFREIRLPIFEDTQLFARSIGADTDVVAKEMYTFEDHDFPVLETRKSELILREPDIGSALSIKDYVASVREFLWAVSSGIKEAKIP